MNQDLNSNSVLLNLEDFFFDLVNEMNKLENIKLRREKMFFEETLKKYIIELFDIKRINTDDYGLVVDFSMEWTLNCLNVQVDVLKGSGQIYFEDQVVITNSDELSMSLRKLFKIVITIFNDNYL
jgi:hypothetical protein